MAAIYSEIRGLLRSPLVAGVAIAGSFLVSQSSVFWGEDLSCRCLKYAQGWKVDADGNVVLVAQAKNPEPQIPWLLPGTCPKL